MYLAFSTSVSHLSHSYPPSSLLFLWNSIPLVLASPLPFILLRYSLMGGFLLFGLCGLPCTFQFFSLQDLTRFTQWGEYLRNELCFAALTIVLITAPSNITRSVCVSGHLKLTTVWNCVYKMNICLCNLEYMIVFISVSKLSWSRIPLGKRL